MKKLYTLLVILILPAMMLAQTPDVKWGGLFYIYNFFHSNTDFISTTDDGNTYMYIHGDFNANVDFGKGVTAYMAIGAWGQHGMSPYYGGGLGENVDPSVRILQAYFTINDLFDTPLSLRIGKERLLYGDGALMFDGGEDGAAGVKLMYKSKMFCADLFYYRYAQMGGIVNVGTGNDVYPGNWNIIGIYPTVKLMDGKIKASPYFITRSVQTSKDETDSPIWYGGRIVANPIDGLDVVLQYVMMGGKNENNDTDYKGTHLRAGVDFTIPNMPLTVGAAYVSNSGDDATTQDNELYESVTNGPYTFGFYKDWPGFGPAHLMTTGYGFSGLAPHNATVVNLDVINGHVSVDLDALTLRGDVFIYGRNWVPDGVESAMGNEIALMAKYNYKDELTFGFTAGVWSPGDHIKNAIETPGSTAKAESAIGGYFWLAKSF